MTVFSITDIAARLTRVTGAYVTPGRVSTALTRLIASGEIPDRRAGGCRVVLEGELPIIDGEFGVTQAMVTAAGGVNV